MRDASMIRKLKLGRRETFAKFFDSYKNLVFYECNNVLHNRMDAEDITQEVFVEFFNHVEELKEDTNLKLYIASLAKKRAIDLYRKKAKSPLYYTDNIESYGDPSMRVDPILTLDHLLEDNEARIVSLKVLYKFSFKEIALEMDLTLGQVQGTYYQAINKLKKYYKKGK